MFARRRVPPNARSVSLSGCGGRVGPASAKRCTQHRWLGRATPPGPGPIIQAPTARVRWQQSWRRTHCRLASRLVSGVVPISVVERWAGGVVGVISSAVSESPPGLPRPYLVLAVGGTVAHVGKPVASVCPPVAPFGLMFARPRCVHGDTPSRRAGRPGVCVRRGGLRRWLRDFGHRRLRGAAGCPRHVRRGLWHVALWLLLGPCWV
jgi:hypothetical protein